MKRFFNNSIGLILTISLLFSLFGCGQPAAGGAEGTASGGLDLDYVGGEAAEAQDGSGQEGTWQDWIAGAFDFGGSASGGSANIGAEGTAGTTVSDAPDSVRDIYQQPGNPNAPSGSESPATGNTSDAAPSASQGGPVNERDSNRENNSQTTPVQPPDNSAGQTEQPALPSASSPIPETTPDSGSGSSTVTMSIRCDTAVANGMHLESQWAGIVPASGVILEAATFEIEEGDTALDVLLQARDKYKLHMEYSGAQSSAYVEGINNLYEYDGGRWSGWMYSVNDWYPNYGCGQYFVKDGDVIEWNYTCDLGLDLEGAAMEGAQDWKDTHE